MAMLKHPHTWTYIATFGALVALTATAYYVVQQDKAVRQQRRKRLAEREIRCQFKLIEDQRTSVERDIGNICDTAEQGSNEKQTQYKLAQCNETLLRLLERLDTIQLRTTLDKGEPAAALMEETTIQALRHRKKRLIRAIEGNFRKLDACQSRWATSTE